MAADPNYSKLLGQALASAKAPDASPNTLDQSSYFVPGIGAPIASATPGQDGGLIQKALNAYKNWWLQGPLGQATQRQLSPDEKLQTAMDIASGFGTDVGAIKAYHGSPYDFNAFDLSKIGTGEGAQAYGHGLYFAENPSVAENYRTRLAGRSYSGGAFDPDNPGHLASKYLINQTPEQAIDALQRQIAQFGGPGFGTPNLQPLRDAIDLIKSGNASPPPSAGRMYEVNINAEPHQLLDWDKPLSQQPQAVQDALLGTGNPVIQAWSGNGAWPHVAGQQAYSTLASSGPVSGMARGNVGGRAAASDVLLQRGVPGIQYLDQGSRAAGDGTRNFVIFDPSLISILRKYGMVGVPSTAAVGSALLNQGNGNGS